MERHDTKETGTTSDVIHIERLEVETRVGVPDEERENAQRLLFSITLTPARGFQNLADDIVQTVDYAAVAEAVKEFAGNRVVKLIETLADETASHLLQRFPIRIVQLQIRKFILPDAEHVAVRVTRQRTTG